MVFLAALPLQVVAEDLSSQIAGVLKYVSVTKTEVASGRVNKPLGENPKGYAVYTKGGRLLFVLVGDNRAKPAGPAVTDAEAVGLFKTSSFGSGTYKVEGKTVIMTFDTSGSERLTGTTQKRYVEITGNKLTVTSDPVKGAGGIDVVYTNILERVE
jgi:hypothetical protein